MHEGAAPNCSEPLDHESLVSGFSAKLVGTTLEADVMIDLSLETPRSRFRAAIFLAVAADLIQIAALPLFSEGALSPADDILDFMVGAAMVRLVGWHWEFVPSFLAELIPGVNVIPFWTLAVVNVYRKWKQAQNLGDRIDVAPLEPKIPNH